MHATGMLHPRPPRLAAAPRALERAFACMHHTSLHLHGLRQTAVSAAPSPASLTSLSGVISDSAVPEGHQGLHSTLYGEGGAERHDASGAEYSIRKGEDDGSMLLPVDEYLGSRDGEKPLGVYALYNTDKVAQYVGYARNMVLAIKAIKNRMGAQRCAFVRPLVFANRSMATRRNMEREVERWIEELGQTPPGNAQEREVWEGTGSAVAAMSDVERAEYDEKKLKMMKAMGESLAQGEKGETDDAAERRRKIMAAVQNDDWSVVIEGQTRAATGAAADSNGAGPPSTSRDSATPGGGAAQQQQPVISPFTKANVHRAIGADQAEAPPVMTVESVDKALDQVRPYLIADGGNVEVAEVAAGRVFLRLEGACNTCTSSATTMRMGIERALQTTFGEQLKEVIQIGASEAQAVTVATVDSHLEKLRSVIHNAGGKVQVQDVKQGTCVIKYSGPDAIGKGIAAAIKDSFPRDIREVQVVSF